MHKIDAAIKQAIAATRAGKRRESANKRFRLHRDSTNNVAALDHFMMHKTGIDQSLQRLVELADDHFNTSPENIDWGNVGTLAEIASLLKRATDFAFGEGENAPDTELPRCKTFDRNGNPITVAIPTD